MSTTYLTELPREFIRIVAGHSAQGLYFIDRAQIQPSEKLKSHIFPNVRRDLANYDNDIYPPNCSGQGFLLLMEQMKTVFLQDSVLLRALYPDHPNFEAALFKSPEYTAFAEKVLAACKDPEVSRNKRMHAVMPTIADEIQGMRQELNSDFGRVEQSQEHSFRAVTRHLTGIGGMLRGATIQIPSYTASINFSLPAYGSYLQPSHTSVLPTGDTPITPSLSFKTSPLSPHTSPPSNQASPALAEHAAVALYGEQYDCVQYEMDSNAITVLNVWYKWHEDSASKPSVVELNHKFEHRWRRTVKTKTAYSMRKKLIEEIDKQASE
jgi:hypothetical protein